KYDIITLTGETLVIKGKYVHEGYPDADPNIPENERFTITYKKVSSDDDGNTPQSALVNTQWSPEKVVPVLPLVGESEDYAQYYPHQSGCDKDYLLFLDQGEMKTYVHEPD